MADRWALLSRRVVLSGEVRAAAVLVEGERIAAVLEPGRLPADVPCRDLGELALLPGLVDAHVHLNEPGRAEWEGFATGTRAAAAGGITTLADMPLNSSPVTTTVAALEAKQSAARGRCHVDVGFHGGLVPGNEGEIAPLIAAGVLGIKAFLCDSGLPEFAAAGRQELMGAAPRLASAGCPLLVHAELADEAAPCPADGRSYRQYLASRPPQWEQAAIELVIDVAQRYGCPAHIVHLANAGALATIAAAQRRGCRLTVETCPHYLHFAAEELPDGDPRFKCAPPIRGRDHREALWQALRNGSIDTIGSDHSPCPPQMKHLASGDLLAAWGGIASLELLLPVVFGGARQRGIGLEQLVSPLCSRPAELLGLGSTKGRIAPGYDADLVALDTAARWTVRVQRLHQRHPVSPYDGVELEGQVMQTWLRGRLVYDRGAFPAPPSGKLLVRGG